MNFCRLLFLMTVSGSLCDGQRGKVCDMKFSDLQHSITTILCPANCWKDHSTLCGSGVYANGPICLAAMHDQWIDGDGGPVTVYKSAGASGKHYKGEKRNGVYSHSCRSNGNSHSFQMTCSVKGDSATKVTDVWCPASCTNEPVYGTNIYSVQSSVCAAAVHAGKLTVSGGPVKFYSAPGQQTYQGSTRNGLATLAKGPSSSSFTFSPTCPRSHYNFNYPISILNFLPLGGYVRYNKPFCSLSAVTMCAWITLRSTSHVQGFFSYRTASNENAFLVEFATRFTAPKSLNIGDGARWQQGAFDWKTGATHFVCGWLDTTKLGISVDGKELCRSEMSGPPLEAGGSFVIGADEHIPQGNYFHNMNGAIDNFVAYPRVLSSAEMTAMATECRCPIDYVISMTPDEATATGLSSASVSITCPILA